MKFVVFLRRGTTRIARRYVPITAMKYTVSKPTDVILKASVLSLYLAFDFADLLRVVTSLLLVVVRDVIIRR